MNSISKTIIITGASGGIARATAERLAKKGYSLCLLSRNYDSNKTFIQQLTKQNNSQQFITYSCDITNEEQVKNSIQQCVSKLGNPVGLVNTAAINIDGLFIKQNSKIIHQLFETNVFGTMNISHAVLPYMIKQKEGSLITIGSIVGEDGNIGQTIYSSTKSALIGFTKSLSKEVSRYNIRCNLIEPGFIDTNLTKNLSQSIKDKVQSNIPLHRFGTPNEIASLIEYLLSPESSYITGSVIRADGGLHI